MFSGIRKFLGAISVVQKGNEIFVEGVNTDIMRRDIKNIWMSNKINANIFSSVERNSFSFPAFFAPDILYTLQALTTHRTLKMSIRTLEKIKTLLLENTWLKNTLVEPVSQLDEHALNNMAYPPLEYHSRFFKAYDRGVQQYGLKGMLFAAAAGSGKTYASLALSEMLGVDKVIVVSPKNALHRVWENNLNTVFKTIPTFWICDSGIPYKDTDKFIVVNYEAIHKAAEIVKSFTDERVMVILDESHNFNSTESLRTNELIDLCKDSGASDVIWLSGTAIKALATEAIPLFRCIDPILFTEDVERRFKRIYGGNNERAVEVLRNRMGIISFKVEKDELNLAPPIFQDIKVKIPNGSEYTLKSVKDAMCAFVDERFIYYGKRKVHDKAIYDRCLEIYKNTLHNNQQYAQLEEYHRNVKTIIAALGSDVKEEIMYCNRFEKNYIIPSLPGELKAQFKDVKSIIKYLHLKIQGECLGRIVGGLRIKCHVDMVNNIDFKAVCDSSKKKTVVFTSFVEVIRECERLIPELGLNPEFVYGKTNINLSSIINTFEKEEDINPLVATYASLSTAVPLVMADTMILIDSPYRDYILTQAVSRIHRLGSDTTCYVYRVILDTGDEPNISGRSFDILGWSRKQSEEIMGIKSPFEIKDSLDDFSTALEGFNELIECIENNKPNFLNW
jgi:superfamily II DNA or RNA helicase